MHSLMLALSILVFFVAFMPVPILLQSDGLAGASSLERCFLERVSELL